MRTRSPSIPKSRTKTTFEHDIGDLTKSAAGLTSRKQEGNAVNAMGKSTVWRYLRIVDPSYILAIAFCVLFPAFYAHSNEEMGSITSISFF